mmetsp:Transcript_18529/g.52040  ORF Transcript_18529/g.52040 Transcript_18529/m.52040 type:complete len:102 (+) Transcript_18529:605-910(+)|eukprot:scaffold142547_cov18-Tisochrysis_lutea.AAC.1
MLPLAVTPASKTQSAVHMRADTLTHMYIGAHARTHAHARTITHIHTYAQDSPQLRRSDGTACKGMDMAPEPVGPRPGSCPIPCPANRPQGAPGSPGIENGC